MTYNERLNDGWLWVILTLTNGFLLWTSITKDTGYPVIIALLVGFTLGMLVNSPMVKRIFGKDC